MINIYRRVVGILNDQGTSSGFTRLPDRAFNRSAGPGNGSRRVVGILNDQGPSSGVTRLPDRAFNRSAGPGTFTMSSFTISSSIGVNLPGNKPDTRRYSPAPTILRKKHLPAAHTAPTAIRRCDPPQIFSRKQKAESDTFRFVKRHGDRQWSPRSPPAARCCCRARQA